VKIFVVEEHMIHIFTDTLPADCGLTKIHPITLQGDDKCRLGVYSCFNRPLAVSQIFNLPSLPQNA